MGWSGGSELLHEVWGKVRPHIPEKKRCIILAQLMSLFSDSDADTLDELVGEFPEAKKAFLKVFPDAEFENEEETYPEFPEEDDD